MNVPIPEIKRVYINKVTKKAGGGEGGLQNHLYRAAKENMITIDL